MEPQMMMKTSAGNNNNNNSVPLSSTSDGPSSSMTNEITTTTSDNVVIMPQQHHYIGNMPISLPDASSTIQQSYTVFDKDYNISSPAEVTCQFIIDHNDHSTDQINHDTTTKATTETTTTATATATDHDKATSSVTTSTTTTTTTTTAVTTTQQESELQIGDHVYQWRHLLGIPGVFQHHGIVMDVLYDDHHQGKVIQLTIADFSNVETKKCKKTRTNQMTTTILNSTTTCTTTVSPPEYNDPDYEHVIDTTTTLETTSTNPKQQQQRRRLFDPLTQKGIVRAYTTATQVEKWYRVHYEAPWWKQQVYRSGTATRAKSDPVGMVLARVNFILQHAYLIPDYHVVYANCECVAFWCKTGHWATLQASRFFEVATVGQVKSSATLAAAAAGATTTVTVPSTGVWGWLGYTTTTQVSWLSLHPIAIPGLACYAAITIGIPAMVYASAHRQWRRTSQRLADAFWEWAIQQPDFFVELITYYSTMDA
jgi:hypothetical protein